jgi:hypothetical protein
LDDGVESRHDPREPEPEEVDLESERPAWDEPTATRRAAALGSGTTRRGLRVGRRSWWAQRSNAAKGALVVSGIVVALAAFGAINRARDSSDGAGRVAATSTTRERQGTTGPRTTEAATTAPSTTTTTLPPPTTAAPTTGPPTPTALLPSEPAPQGTGAPLAAPASSCDPNYAGGCVPVASDVDCAGGSGNGPAYVSGPVQIVGSDVYDLDSDGDGLGCEG